MRKLLRKKADPPQQSASLPPVQTHKSHQSPPPLFTRFASSNSSGSAPSPPVISGPAPLAPRDSIHRHGGPHDGSPPKPTNPRAGGPSVQRNRTHEKRQSVNDGKVDKPLPDLDQAPLPKANPHAFYREPTQLFESRAAPVDVNYLPPKSNPEFRKREDLPRNAELTPLPLDPPSTPTKSKDMARRANRTPKSSSPDKKPSTGPEPSPSGLLALQNPPDQPQPRRKYSPLEAFGLVSGENSPATSTATSSVNLPSQNSVSAPSNIPVLKNYCIHLFTSPLPTLNSLTPS